MTNTDDASPNKSSDANSAWERLPAIQQRHVAGLVANAIKRDDFGSGDFERLCNALATAMLRDHTVDPATLLSAVMPSQREVRERIEDIAASAMSAELQPYREQVTQAQQKLLQMPRENQEKIEAEIDARVKQEKAPNGRRLTVISRVLAREKILVAIMNDAVAIEQVLAQPSVAVEGRWPR